MSQSNRKNLGMFSAGVLIALFFGGYAMIGATDYEQALADEAFYCSMAEQGAWPRTAEHPCPNGSDVVDTQYAGL